MRELKHSTTRGTGAEISSFCYLTMNATKKMDKWKKDKSGVKMERGNGGAVTYL